jgi:hypothetical protein
MREVRTAAAPSYSVQVHTRTQCHLLETFAVVVLLRHYLLAFCGDSQQESETDLCSRAYSTPLTVCYSKESRGIGFHCSPPYKVGVENVWN